MRHPALSAVRRWALGLQGQAPSPARPRPWGRPRRAALALGTSAALSPTLWACDPPAQERCDPPCSEGFICEQDTRSCVANRLEPYASPAPGRALRAVLWEQEPLMAMISPQENAVVLKHGQRPARVLSRDVRAGSLRLALAARDQRAWVAWISRQGYYQLAQSGSGQLDSPWSISPVREGDPNAAPSYAASQDFALAVDEEGAAHLVFRDAQRRQLVHLWRPAQETDWRRALIDDGASSLGVEVCPASTRQRVALGVGYEPDLLAAQRELWVAYFDADCADLRVARRGQQRWQISLVDQGEGLPESPGQRSAAGRWPSLALAPDGTLGVSYQDATLGRLMFARLTGDAFTREIIDPGLALDLFGKTSKKLVGAYSQLSFDAQGAPLITYMDGGDAAVLSAALVQQTPRRWAIQRRMDEGLVGFWTTHVRLPDGQLWLGAERLTPEQGRMTSQLVSVTVTP